MIAAGSATANRPPSPLWPPRGAAAAAVGAFPAGFDVTRIVTVQALVSLRGNHYPVPPGLASAVVHVRHRLGADTPRIVTAGGATVAVHRRALDGGGRVIHDDGHIAALEKAVLGAFQ